ncbi:hypothetical protein K8S17_06385, partial [bacterium]|nr:hypothetical protein [bacterium]
TETWSGTFGGARSEMANGIHATVDGGFLISASTGTFGEGNSNYYLVRTDSSGAELWTRSHGTAGPFGHGFDWCSGICPTEDGCVLVGYSDCQDLMDAHVVAMDGEGQEIWDAAFGPTIFYDYACGACPTSSGLAVCGTNKAFDGTDSVYLLELAADGTLVCESTFGGVGSCWGSGICAAGGRGDDEDRGTDVFVVGHVAGHIAGPVAGHVENSDSNLHDALVMRVETGK